MAVEEILLPRTSDAMTEAVVSTWLVERGNHVAEGTLVAEVETDKALVEVASDYDGVFVPLVTTGAQVNVGTAIALVLSGDDVAAFERGELDAGPAVPTAAAPAPAAPAAPTTGADTTVSPVASTQPAAATTSTQATSSSPATQPLGRVLASPIARKRARDTGLDIASLSPGSGPNGRVVRADVDAALTRGAASGGTVQARSNRDRALADAMVRSKGEIPHFYLFRDMDVTAVARVRDELKAAGLPAPSLTAFLVKAVGIAVAELPAVNRVWSGGDVVQLSAVAVGVAVADGDYEVIVPTVKGPERKLVQQIADDLSALAERARARRLTGADMEGASVTISNLGMYGIDAMLPIIPPGQSAILGIGRSRDVPRATADGSWRLTQAMSVGYAGDHRVVSGLGAARMLERIAELLASPSALLIHEQHTGSRTDLPPREESR